MKLLSEATFRIRKLHIFFKHFKEDEMLLKHIGCFSGLKVEEKTTFMAVALTRKLTPDAQAEYKGLFEDAAAKAFDKMMGKREVPYHGYSVNTVFLAGPKSAMLTDVSRPGLAHWIDHNLSRIRAG